MAVTNFHQFQADLRKFAESIDVKFETVVRRVIVDLFRRIVERTPVDTGRLRASWTISINSPDLDVAPDRRYSPAEAAAKAREKEKIAYLSRPMRQVVYISNGLPYAEVIENGHSKQAPVGMVMISVTEIEAEIALELDRRGA
jgi:hypothetical protein